METTTATAVRQRSKIARIAILVGLLAAFLVVPFLFELVTAHLKWPLMTRVSAEQAGLMLVVIAFALLDGDGFRSLGLTARWQGVDAAVVPGLIFFHFAISIVGAIFLQKMGWIDTQNSAGQLLNHFGTYQAGSFVFYALGLAAQAGIGEEMLFRGYLITRLEKLGAGAWGAILGSALLFGLVHWPGYGLAPALLKSLSLGIPTGAYFYYRRNLGPVMAAHLFIDFAGFMAAFAAAKLHLPGL